MIWLTWMRKNCAKEISVDVVFVGLERAVAIVVVVGAEGLKEVGKKKIDDSSSRSNEY